MSSGVLRLIPFGIVAIILGVFATPFIMVAGCVGAPIYGAFILGSSLLHAAVFKLGRARCFDCWRIPLKDDLTSDYRASEGDKLHVHTYGGYPLVCPTCLTRRQNARTS